MTIYVNNTNLIELLGLKNLITGLFVNNAIVMVTIKDEGSINVAGQLWPLAMPYVAASSGDYRALLTDELVLVAGAHYTAFIEVDGGINLQGHWEFPFRPYTRTE